MISNTNSEFEDFIDLAPWDRLQDAYGNSAAVSELGNIAPLPMLLKQLLSDDRDQRNDAVNDGLWGRACHQYSVYTATSYAAKAVIILLRDPTLENKRIQSEFLIRETLNFLCEVWLRIPRTETARTTFPVLQEEAFKSRNSLKAYEGHSDPEVREYSSRLISAIGATMGQ